MSKIGQNLHSFEKILSIINWELFRQKGKIIFQPYTNQLLNFQSDLVEILKQNKKVATQHPKRCRMTTFVQRDNITFSFRVADSQR